MVWHSPWPFELMIPLQTQERDVAKHKGKAARPAINISAFICLEIWRETVANALHPCPFHSVKGKLPAELVWGSPNISCMQPQKVITLCTAELPCALCALGVLCALCTVHYVKCAILTRQRNGNFCVEAYILPWFREAYLSIS